MRGLILLAAVIVCWLVVAALFVSALGVYTCAFDTCPPNIIALPLALGSIVGVIVALWLWEVYKNR